MADMSIIRINREKFGNNSRTIEHTVYLRPLQNFGHIHCIRYEEQEIII